MLPFLEVDKENTMIKHLISKVWLAWIILLIVVSSSSMALAQTTVVTFDGLDTTVRTCTSTFGTFTIGEDVTTQFQSLGVVFSANEFGIVRGKTFAGDAAIALNTIDNSTNRCPVGRFGNNGALTAIFVDPVSGIGTDVSDVSVFIVDAETDVHVRTLDRFGGIIHECRNIFSGCPFVRESDTFTVDLLFPGGGIAKIEFIDEGLSGYADGFTMDNLGFDPDPVIAPDQRVQELESQMEYLIEQIEAIQQDLLYHTHSYRTGKGKGHNKVEATTGAPKFSN